MRFLVVGASGFVGGHAFDHLRAAGHEVVGTYASHPSPELIRFDLAHDKFATELAGRLPPGDGPVHVVITAFNTNMQQCERDPQGTRPTNVDGIIRLCDDVAAVGAVPMFLSTGSVFDGEAGYYADDEVPCPVSEYGRQKAEVEVYLQTHHPSAFIGRLDMIMGDSPDERHPAADWWARLQRGDELPCVEGSLLSPTYVRDVARGLEAAAANRLTGLYNLVNSEFFHRDELARQFCRIMGHQGKVVARPLESFGFADRRGLRSYLDSRRFRNATGMTFTTMREIFLRFKANVGG